MENFITISWWHLVVAVVFIVILITIFIYYLGKSKSAGYEKWDLILKGLQILFLFFAGVVITLVISNNQNVIALSISENQNSNAKYIAMNQQKLFALQIFNDKLMSDRIRRETTIRIIKVFADTGLTEKMLADSLIEISNRATLEILRYDIWNTDPRVREDAIKEYAKLYKKYPLDVLDALMPRGYHLGKEEPIISIAKFFYYLEIYSDSLWYGTELDLKRFMKIKETKFYKNNYPHLHRFVDICERNFRDTNIVYPREFINLHENDIQDEMMDD